MPDAQGRVPLSGTSEASFPWASPWGSVIVWKVGFGHSNELVVVQVFGMNGGNVTRLSCYIDDIKIRVFIFIT